MVVYLKICRRVYYQIVEKNEDDVPGECPMAETVARVRVRSAGSDRGERPAGAGPPCGGSPPPSGEEQPML